MKRAAAAALLALAVLACREEGQAPAAREGGAAVSRQDKPRLALLTSLPIAFPEEFNLQAPAHPVMTALERRFDVQLVDGPGELPPGGLFLAVQPRALTAERLVDLDQWVRDGGRMVLLADPMLEWESERPLGDMLRPPVTFPDTGLLRHWGLVLFAPDERGPRTGNIAGQEVLTASPGELSAPGGSCRVQQDGLVASCALGRGEVTVIADADFLNLAGAHALDGPTDQNIPALIAALRRSR